jgi:hypothetical protein
MNPEMLVKLANERVGDLQQTAADSHASRAAEPRDSIRQRTGWALVQVGLRLALPAQRSRRQAAH